MNIFRSSFRKSPEIQVMVVPRKKGLVSNQVRVMFV